MDPRDAIRNAKRPLALAVGGGNDSVSSLLALRTFGAQFGFAPDTLAIAAMLPDCLDYLDTRPGPHPLACLITPDSRRSAGGRITEKFPERILASRKDTLPGLPISSVYGLSMREGSRGIARALLSIMAHGQHDLLLACDVGGDFIATADNLDVLSPMMDGYALSALRMVKTQSSIPIACCVFGLGTDGESSPGQIDAALGALRAPIHGLLDPEACRDIESLHRQWVEPNRYSRTMDFTLRTLYGPELPGQAPFRARFHVPTPSNTPPIVHYGVFDHRMDSAHAGRFVLFEDLDGLDNPFAIDCDHALDWLTRIPRSEKPINHELCGQTISGLDRALEQPELAGARLFIATPSSKFTPEQRSNILSECRAAQLQGAFEIMAFRSDDAPRLRMDESEICHWGPHLILASTRKILLDALRALAPSRSQSISRAHFQP